MIPDDVMLCILEDVGMRQPTEAEAEAIFRHLAEGHGKLAALPKRKRGSAPDDSLLSVKRAAEVLGIHFKSLHRWIEKGCFNSDHGLTRIGRGGGQLRVRRSLLMQAIRDGKLHNQAVSATVSAEVN